MQVLLGLGGNLGDVGAAFARAAGALAGRFRVRGASGVWRTAPIGPPQPEFLNAALLVEVDVDLWRLLGFCQRLEAAAGRDRAGEPRLGPRPLDVDLLLSPGLVVEAPALTLPHPRLAARRFALLPACELAAGWPHPRLHRTLAVLASALSAGEQPCRRDGPFPKFGSRSDPA